MSCVRGLGRQARAVLAAATVALTLAGCGLQAQSPVVGANVVEAMRAPSAEGWARATQPRAFTFPLDHGAHPAYRTEWWYYTGNLSAADGPGDGLADGPGDGRAYGYQLTFFRSGLQPDATPRASDLAARHVYMAHFAVSDGLARRHVSAERYARGAGGLAGATGDPLFAVWLEDWSAREVEPGVVRLRASATVGDTPIAIDLTLRETRPPLLHGEHGLHQKGPEIGNASYYYSLTGLETEGRLLGPSGEVAVKGTSWMDHEFGTSALAEGVLGWNWLSLQLEDGSALMLYGFRMAEGAAPVAVIGTWLAADGAQMPLHGSDFTITPTDNWTSPRTGINYPVAWQVEVPALGLDLDVTSLFPDQEMNVQFVYWEGAVRAEGKRGEEPVTARGYVELTGYGAPAGEFQR